MIPQLKFDSSQSALFRPFGVVYEINVHWANGSKVAQSKLICPDSLAPENEEDSKGWNIKKAKKLKCKLCQSGSAQNYQRWLTLGWDVAEDRWCIFMTHVSVVASIMEQSKKAGISPEMIEMGKGANVILTRIGNKTEAVVLTETAGAKCGKGSPPLIEEVASELRRFSLWTKHDSIGSLLQDEAEKAEAGITKYQMPVPQPYPVPMPPPPEVKKKATKMDPNKLLGESRWDFLG